ncbi:MAG TPA: glycosyltransferase family 4 protein [Candidatus Woesebacteria bacterium]|nr:glycosyltransferase family 4 protein [Candidatus Woesebacteria bacterium]
MQVKKKILFFSPYYHPYISGMTTYPALLLSELSKQFEIKVLTFKHQPDLLNHENINGADVIRMPYWFKLSKGFISLQANIYFVKYLKACDVLLINLPSVESFSLALIAKLMGKKIIGIYHCKLHLDANWYWQVIGWIVNKVVNLAITLCDKIVFYTQDYYQSLDLHLSQKAEFYLPPVPKVDVDSEYFHHLLNTKGNEIWIGYAGRVSNEKGLEYLVEACALLHNKQKVRLVLAGPYGEKVAGEAGYYHLIKSQLTKYQLPHTFFGTLRGGKLGAFYQAINLLVLPSINQTEAFGMVQIEAMMLGTPVVVSNLPGVRVPVNMTGMGRVVEPRNASALFDSIRKVLKVNTKISDKTESFFQEFLVNNAAGRYVKIINQIL